MICRGLKIHQAVITCVCYGEISSACSTQFVTVTVRGGCLWFEPRGDSPSGKIKLFIPRPIRRGRSPRRRVPDGGERPARRLFVVPGSPRRPIEVQHSPELRVDPVHLLLCASTQEAAFPRTRHCDAVSVSATPCHCRTRTRRATAPPARRRLLAGSRRRAQPAGAGSGFVGRAPRPCDGRG